MQPDGGSGSSTEDCASLQLVRASLQQCVSLHEITLAYAWAKSLEAQRTAARSRQKGRRQIPDGCQLKGGRTAEIPPKPKPQPPPVPLSAARQFEVQVVGRRRWWGGGGEEDDEEDDRYFSLRPYSSMDLFR